MSYNLDRKNNPEFLNDYLTHIRIVQGCLERTVFAYFIDVRMFLRYVLKERMEEFKEIPLEEISIKDFPSSMLKDIYKADIYDYLRYATEDRKNNPISRARIVSSLRSFFKYLKVNTTFIEDNPTENIDMHRPRHPMIKYLTLEQSRQLLDSIDTSKSYREYCMITLFLNCGMRLSELVAINISDINFSEKTLLLHGKGNKDRQIYLNDACINALQRYLSERDNPENEPNAVFLSTHKKRITPRRIEQLVDKALENAGLGNMGFSVHKLRHTSATLMYQYGEVDTLVIKEVLGHSNIATTEVYTHTSNEQIRNASEDNPLSDYGIKNKGTDI
ncbi:MAG: tyrosine-type recombinase/integrase [Oscillospiraceae bacterium]